MLDITTQNENGDLIFLLTGRLDSETSPKLEEALTDAFVKPNRVIFNCAALQFMSSAGLRVLVKAHKQAVSLGKAIVVKNINEEIMQIFVITNLTSLLTIE